MTELYMQSPLSGLARVSARNFCGSYHKVRGKEAKEGQWRGGEREKY